MRIESAIRKKPFIIAEIGNNHEGDLGLAKEMVAAAAESGADAVKFQAINPEALVNGLLRPDRLERLRELCLDFDGFATLSEQARGLGVFFGASIFDLDSCDRFDYFDFYKVASSDFNYQQLIKKIAEKDKPLVLSSGMSSAIEINNVVEIVGSRSAPTVICHCVSLYPAPLDTLNLGALSEIGRLIKGRAILGYSDHSDDLTANIVAASLGATVFEKHFTLSKTHSEFRDHSLASTPDELVAYRAELEKAFIARGKGNLEERDVAELDVAKEARRAVFLKRDLKKGDVVALNDLLALRPALGIKCEEMDALVGKVALVDISRLQELSWSNFD